MKIKIILISLVLLVLYSGIVSACMGSPPSIETKNNNTFCLTNSAQNVVDSTGQPSIEVIITKSNHMGYMVPDGKPCNPYRSKTISCSNAWFDEELRNEFLFADKFDILKDVCGLTDSDVSILKDYISNGYTVKEQTDEEYSLFLNEANKANEWRPNTCLDYVAVSHRGKWTGFMRSGIEYRNGQCLITKCGSFGGVSKIIWNDLPSLTKRTYAYIIVPILAISLIVFLVLRFRKK